MSHVLKGIAKRLRARSERALKAADIANETFGKGHGISIRIHGEVLKDVAEAIEAELKESSTLRLG